jgi:transcriptional regulator with XRE-family HTH domain
MVGMQREQLADFLRRRRAAIRPAEVGIADGPRRRTAGLRREEVARLAGMSVDYVVRLEQGRSSQPSTQLLGALARALRLSEDERAHLFHLAGHQPPRAEGLAGMARLGLVRVIDLLVGTPALVLSDLGEVLAQNSAATLLMGDLTAYTGDQRYIVYRWFTDPATRGEQPPEEQERQSRSLVSDLGEVLAQNYAATLLMGDLTAYTGDERYIVYRWFTDPSARGEQPPEEQERQSRSLVADLRAVVGRRPADREVTRLIERLQAESLDFRRLWSEHEVGVRRADRKTFVHPRVGPILMDCETLVTPDLGQELLVLSPANREAAERLGLLLVLGTEEFPEGVVWINDRS